MKNLKMFFSKSVISIFLAMSITSLAFAADILPREAVYFASGANSDVYKVPGHVYNAPVETVMLKVYKGGGDSRNLAVQLTNFVADRVPDVPRLQAVGQSSAIQYFVEGKSAFQLSAVSADASLKAIDLKDERVSMALREFGMMKFGKPLLFDEFVTEKNGISWKVDSSRENFRFFNDGRISGWFDVVFIKDQAYEKQVARTIIIPTPTGLPVESSAPLLNQAPPADKLGLTSLKTFTFLNFGMAGGDIALTYVDYIRAIKKAKSPEDKAAVDTKFITDIMTSLKWAVGGAVVVGLSAVFAPAALTAGLTAGFLGLGLHGFGSHLTATFGGDFMDYVETVTGDANRLNDSLNPRFEQMRRIQKEELQLKLKSVAAQRNGFNGTITNEDVQRTAILMDSSFIGKEVNYGNGITRSMIIAKENQLFMIYADIKQTLRMKPNGTTKDTTIQKLAEATAIKSQLVQLRSNTGLPVRTHDQLEKDVRVFASSLFEGPPPAPMPPMAVSGTHQDIANQANNNIYSQNPYLAPIGWTAPANYVASYQATTSPGSFSTSAPYSYSAGITPYSPGRAQLVNSTTVAYVRSVTIQFEGAATASTFYYYFDRNYNPVYPGDVGP